ncbi:T-cell immunoreceptor with Ig and ITIM domains isoform X1 [Aquarana catesbeiana]|uniref:T-cell immunoreceptor with Ig and ITIM domains isoform X1 n=1 Tax=Aquarana catesbeiana TaxID=8400 RepID=UPI003CC99F6E
MSLPGPFISLLVICSLLHLPGSSSGTSVKTHNLTATIGGEVTLKCQLLVQDTKVTQVNWNLCNDVHIASHINGHTTKGAVVGKFTERVSLAEDYGIQISNVNSSDADFYCCVFYTFPHGKFTGRIYLEVITEGSTWTLEHYSWTALPCGILLLAAGGLAIFCHKRKSRLWLNSGKPNSLPIDPANMGVPGPVPAVSAAQDGEDDSQSQEYFNVIPYGSLRAH